jgi:hypothetical protein
MTREERFLNTVLLTVREDPEGRSKRADGLMARFVAVPDADDAPIREMVRRTEVAGFGGVP